MFINRISTHVAVATLYRLFLCLLVLNTSMVVSRPYDNRVAHQGMPQVESSEAFNTMSKATSIDSKFSPSVKADHSPSNQQLVSLSSHSFYNNHQFDIHPYRPSTLKSVQFVHVVILQVPSLFRQIPIKISELKSSHSETIRGRRKRSISSGTSVHEKRSQVLKTIFERMIPRRDIVNIWKIYVQNGGVLMPNDNNVTLIPNSRDLRNNLHLTDKMYFQINFADDGYNQTIRSIYSKKYLCGSSNHSVFMSNELDENCYWRTRTIVEKKATLFVHSATKLVLTRQKGKSSLSLQPEASKPLDKKNQRFSMQKVANRRVPSSSMSSLASVHNSHNSSSLSVHSSVHSSSFNSSSSLSSDAALADWAAAGLTIFNKELHRDPETLCILMKNCARSPRPNKKTRKKFTKGERGLAIVLKKFNIRHPHKKAREAFSSTSTSTISTTVSPITSS